MIIRDGRTLSAICKYYGFSYHKEIKYIITGYNPTFSEIIGGKTLSYRGGAFRLEYINLCGRYYPFVVKH